MISSNIVSTKYDSLQLRLILIECIKDDSDAMILMLRVFASSLKLREMYL